MFFMCLPCNRNYLGVYRQCVILQMGKLRVFRSSGKPGHHPPLLASRMTPFVDGNGRTARALFYWQMLHSHRLLAIPIHFDFSLSAESTGYNMAWHSCIPRLMKMNLTYFIIHQARNYTKSSSRTFMNMFAQIVEARRLALTPRKSILRINHRQQEALINHAVRHQASHLSQIAGHQSASR